MLFPLSGGTNQLLCQSSGPFCTEVLWTIIIAGYGYTADSSGYWFALTILFTCLLFVFGHIGCTIYKRYNSVAWWPLPDVVALCHDSHQSALPRNVIGGISLKATYQPPLKLRVHDSADAGENEEVAHVSNKQESLELRIPESCCVQKGQERKEVL